ncbi:bifunctional adenosylcobinamide kinase/adenosylcobinamide-phosphate guanylyltransferase [Psychromarinibacter sp. C21-152]|uniref:Bifunctional adenosylcobalamin biosynthesis protein n=1 Tax=Psychromarinibacter sediminicola TaxID=3033385 RepID=A0AAE3T9V5_9RHOB|nr:bifunctional adenosylcobinamide kinase/adenosylcobinamide-phosphate guanylyltransferase [Psychromarinibacter sediminicola]MDF0603035.1 bifunctional adenosylcobinamide kinase/adenosylcobinamide-phosphate guanylyltransferase [Psychromarinibacter sediminicola]
MAFQRAVVLGGSRSGKSFFAERLVRDRPAPWIYLATSQAHDTEMEQRIAAHAARRGPGWQTVEEPKKISDTLGTLPEGSTVLLECATLWLSNHMLDDSDLAAETDALLAAIDAFPGRIVTVTSEVGSGVVPESALGRRFRDAQGLLNQRLAAQADLAVLVAAGLPLVLKGRLPEGIA